VRAIADGQWAAATFSTVSRAFAIAQDLGRTTWPRPDLEVAEGSQYQILRDNADQTLTVVVRASGRSPGSTWGGRCWPPAPRRAIGAGGGRWTSNCHIPER
jgi:hypothetical protein